MKLRRYAAVFLSIGAIIAVLLTPLGPWSMLRLCTAFIEPWTLRVGTVEGSFWSGVTLRDAHLYNEAQGLRLRARKIALSPYDRSLSLQEPHYLSGDPKQCRRATSTPRSSYCPPRGCPTCR